MSRIIIAAALMALFASPASAALFRVSDLGEMPSRQACMATAKNVLESYLDEYAAGRSSATPKIPKAGRSTAGASGPATTISSLPARS